MFVRRSYYKKRGGGGEREGEGGRGRREGGGGREEGGRERGRSRKRIAVQLKIPVVGKFHNKIFVGHTTHKIFTNKIKKKEIKILQSY